MLGYSALTLSVNRAIQSFGIAAAAGEICCVITGVVVLPACLTWLSKGRERPSLF
jgi:predicted RND superfamily exporter protein